jgi:hypothetical protein
MLPRETARAIFHVEINLPLTLAKAAPENDAFGKR